MELARDEADMDLLEFMEAEAGGAKQKAPCAGAAAGAGRPRKRRREQTDHARPAVAAIIVVTARSQVEVEKERAVEQVDDDDDCRLSGQDVVVMEERADVQADHLPPRLVDYPDSEGADADLDAATNGEGDSEATELPDESDRSRPGEEDADDDNDDVDEGDSATRTEAESTLVVHVEDEKQEAEASDEDSEQTQSMDMDEMSATISLCSTAAVQTLDDAVPTVVIPQRLDQHTSEGEQEIRPAEEQEGERPQTTTTVDKPSERRDTKADGERPKSEQGKRRLPNWMVLTPKQLKQAQAEKEREMRESKDTLREQAMRYFEIMQSDSDASTESSESVASLATQSPPATLEPPAAETAAVVRLTSTLGETRVCVSDTVSYIDVLTPIDQGRVVIFDLETSGFGAEDSIIEIGAVELMDGQRTGIVFQSYAKAMGSVNPYAFKAHGLSEEFLSHHQSIEVVLASFMRWVGTAPLVAHNSRFDMRMLCQELRRWDLPLNANKIFCTLRYYRAKYPGMPYSLDDLANRFHIDQIIERHTHGALVDAEICARVYQKFLDAL